MRCDDIHEYLVDLLYQEDGAPQAGAEMQEHLRTCPDCMRELEEMRKTRKYLQAWKDESPLHSVAVPGQEFAAKRGAGLRYLRYAAVAAMVCICILAAANARITLNKDGFSFSTHLFPQDSAKQDYYTKTEVRDIVKRALDDSEMRMTETTYTMAQRIFEAFDQEQSMDMHLVRSRSAQNRNRN